MFIFARESAHASRGGAERMGSRGFKVGSARTAESPTWGSNPQTIMTWAEVRCLTDWATQAPYQIHFSKHLFLFWYYPDQKSTVAFQFLPNEILILCLVFQSLSRLIWTYISKLMFHASPIKSSSPVSNCSGHSMHNCLIPPHWNFFQNVFFLTHV